MDTKACTITEEEVKVLMGHHMNAWDSDMDERLDRLNYLNKRLKAFKEDAKIEEAINKNEPMQDQTKETIQPPPQPVAQTGW